MNIFFIAASSFIVALSGALVPGPLFTVTVSESLRRGFKAGPLIILGHGLLEIALIVLLVSKVTPFLLYDGTRIFIFLSGGILLITMGLMLLKDSRNAHIDITSSGRSAGLNPVIIGIVGSISNPYWVIWWVTIGLGYLLSSLKFGTPGVIAFFSGHIFADLLWYSMISYSVSRGRQFLRQTGYRYILSLCGFFLVLFGGWFILAARR